MLKLSNVDAYYGESCILRNLSLEVPEGKIVGLIGRNGVGKSTTLRSIMGLIKTPEGKIQMNGEDLIKLPTYERVKRGIGYVPQGRDIFPQMTVEEKGRFQIISTMFFRFFPSSQKEKAALYLVDSSSSWRLQEP